MAALTIENAHLMVKLIQHIDQMPFHDRLMLERSIATACRGPTIWFKTHQMLRDERMRRRRRRRQ